MVSFIVRHVFLVIGVIALTASAHAQSRLSGIEIISSLETLPGAAYKSVDVSKAQAELLQRIRAEATENATTPFPLMVELQTLPNVNLEVNFDFDSAFIQPGSYRTIGAITDALLHPILRGNTIIIIGHTDAKGSREYNLKLSEQRAQEVRNALVGFNIPAEHLVALGMGEEQLRDPANPDAAINRRVQLINIGRAQ